MKDQVSYSNIYWLLREKYERKENITLDELCERSKLKESSIKVYIRNKLKYKFIQPIASNKFQVLAEIQKYDEKKFIKWMSQKSLSKEEQKKLPDELAEHSIQAMISAIEIHNKPQIKYRYQIVTILIINAWELILKAYISKYQPKTKLIKKDGTTKTFLECLKNVKSTIGKYFFSAAHNIELLYDYRCDFIHFYNSKLDLILFSLLQKTIIFYNTFISNYFGKELSSIDDLFVLPICFKKPISPVEFVTNESELSEAPDFLKKFIEKLIIKTEELKNAGIDELIFVPYSIAYKSEKRLKNADIIAAITNNKTVKIGIEEKVKITNEDNAKEIKIKEETIYSTLYNKRYKDIVEFCRHNIKGWKQNKIFYEHMKELKKDPGLHRVRLLDPNNPKSVKKDFYSPKIFEKLVELYSNDQNTI